MYVCVVVGLTPSLILQCFGVMKYYESCCSGAFACLERYDLGVPVVPGHVPSTQASSIPALSLT